METCANLLFCKQVYEQTLSTLARQRSSVRDQHERMRARVLTKPLNRVARIFTHTHIYIETRIESFNSPSYPASSPPFRRAHPRPRGVSATPACLCPRFERSPLSIAAIDCALASPSRTSVHRSTRKKSRYVWKKALCPFSKKFFSFKRLARFLIFMFYERCFLIFFF